MEKVSVIMPCYNDGAYIQESIDSVLDSTYKNIELIIVDDGSTDESTIKTLAQIHDGRIRIFYNNHLGPAAARNFAIGLAEGTYILPVDADDLIEKTYIEKAVSILENDEMVGVVYCFAKLFGERNCVWDLPKFSMEAMLVDNIVFVTAMFRKRTWEKVKGFCIELKHGMEDYDFWLSILQEGLKIVQIPEFLFFYRIKPVSRTTKFILSDSVVKDTYKLIYLRHKSLYL